MLLYTEEAATEEECISKISRIHKIEGPDFNERVKIIKIRRLTRGALLGMVKKNVVEITYLFTPQSSPPQVLAKKSEYAPSYQAASPAFKLSAPSTLGQASRSPSSESDFAENKRKLLYSVFKENPDIRERISAEQSQDLFKAPSSKSSKPKSEKRKLEQRQGASSSSITPAIEDDKKDESYDFPSYEYPVEPLFDEPIGKPKSKSSAKSAQASSLEMNELIQEVRKIGQRIDMTAEIGNSSSGEHRNISKLMDILELNDFTPSFMSAIRERVRSELTIEALSDFEYLQRLVLSWIGSYIKVSTEHSAMRPHIIVLVGPTGAGKTTTVAKLAAAYIRAYKKAPRPLNVRVITIDNYRIGAKQHLEKYGEIMGVTVSAAETPQDLHRLIALHQDADIILVDTTGRSPKDRAEILSMSAFFTGLQDSCETLLAVSACTKASDLHDIIRQYGVFSLDGLIITKFDETSRVGNIISVLAGHNLPVSYVTTGQRVPKDFEAASVMKFLLALEGFSANMFTLRQEFPEAEKRFEWS